MGKSQGHQQWVNTWARKSLWLREAWWNRLMNSALICWCTSWKPLYCWDPLPSFWSPAMPTGIWEASLVSTGVFSAVLFSVEILPQVEPFSWLSPRLKIAINDRNYPDEKGQRRHFILHTWRQHKCFTELKIWSKVHITSPDYFNYNCYSVAVSSKITKIIHLLSRMN